MSLTTTAANEQRSRNRRIDQPTVRRQKGLRWLLLAALVGGVIWAGERRESLGPAHGKSLAAFHVAPLTNDVPLRVGTFNIHGGKGDDRRVDLERVADCLRGLHVVGLNEVRGSAWSADAHQAATLGEILGLAWLYAPAEQRWWYQRFGNGVLSALHVEHWQRIPLAMTDGRSYRNVVLLHATYRERPLKLLITHIDRRSNRDRQAQLQAVSQLFLSLAPPVILMGDMNTGADDPLIQRLLDTPGVVDPVGEFLTDSTPPRIDWILTRGFRALDANLVETIASDHPYVWAELELAD